jgi:hypothetical protein
MENYTKVLECFQKKACQILTTFEEFEERRQVCHKQSYQFVRVDFIGSCSHSSSSVFTNFKLRNTGIVCKECVIQQSRVSVRMNTNESELMGIKIFEEYVTEYEIKRTKEGCRADLAIKKKTDQLWIPIQIKTTMKSGHGMYSFKQCNKDYAGMLLILICITEKKIWILPFSTEINSNINISLKSKYNQYFVQNDNIAFAIDQYRDKVVMTELSVIMRPVTILQQREQEYVQKRERCLPFLTYDYPEIQSGASDFICNGKKVQEKVMGLAKKKLQCTFGHSNGKKNGKYTLRTYMLGENDYYWFHSSIDDRFWIISETVLHEKGYISNANDKKNKCNIFLSDNKWNAYLYHYDHVEQERIMKLFL